MHRKLIIPLLFFLIFSLACNLSSPRGPAEPTPTPKSEQPVKAPTHTPKPEATTPTEPTAPPVPEGLITNLDDSEKAVLRVITEGGFEFPGLGDYQQTTGGSGFIIDPSGLVVTNNHVVTGAATVKVYFYGETKPHNARILGASECSDLAVIKLTDEESYPYFEWYTSDIKAGLRVFSMGYPQSDPEIARHEGGVSRRSADISTSWASVSAVLEHDAITNPGSSGGPLLTEDAKVVGINYASATGMDQYYAIAYKEARPILTDLEAGKNVLWVGINGEAFATDDGDLAGILVYSVASGSPADRAGIKSGDIIEKMEGIQLATDGTKKDYCDILRSKGDSAALTVRIFRYATAETLEGQINGRPLAPIG